MGPVAGKAKPGQPDRKAAKKLRTRIADYERTVAARKDASGYHKPGSRQR